MATSASFLCRAWGDWVNIPHCLQKFAIFPIAPKNLHLREESFASGGSRIHFGDRSSGRPSPKTSAQSAGPDLWLGHRADHLKFKQFCTSVVWSLSILGVSSAAARTVVSADTDWNLPDSICLLLSFSTNAASYF